MTPDTRYFTSIAGGLWATSVVVDDHRISLIQHCFMAEEDIDFLMKFLKLKKREIDIYFPRLRKGDRGPTIELFNRLHAHIYGVKEAKKPVTV